jgi:hypothetical protein
VSQSQRQLREAWGQFLSQFPWDWFVNLTFRGEVLTFRAYRLVGRFLRDMEADAGVPIHWFRADEYGARLGKFHMHLLIGNVAHLRGSTGWTNGTAEPDMRASSPSMTERELFFM